MTPKPISLLTLGTLLLFTSCSTPSTHYREPGLPGGYSRVEINPDVVAAAKFATKEQSRREYVPIALVQVLRAEQQVVAGMNYKMALKVSKTGHMHVVEASVFRGLDGHYELRDWRWKR